MSPIDDPFPNVPTASVYQMFVDSAVRLTARYNALCDAAATPERRDYWWAKVMELRDMRRAVPAHDRQQLLGCIAQWSAELDQLESGGHG